MKTFCFEDLVGSYVCQLFRFLILLGLICIPITNTFLALNFKISIDK